MGIIPPPRALTKKEFDARVKAGVKTMAEIDPALAKWAIGFPMMFFRKKKKRVLKLLNEEYNKDNE